jgi:endogenous inhibitor of DNA gyrase (YacG/DUF329 family)
MTITQKQQITEMRAAGETLAAIAAKIGLSENTVKSYCRRNKVGAVENAKPDICPECGLPLVHLSKKRQTRFCSDKCRLAWWQKHPDALNRKAVYSFKCAACGADFESYGNANRKYCSRSCSAAARRAAHE